MSKQKKAANAAKKSSRSAMRRTLMFLGDAAAGNGSRSNNSSRLLIIFLCGYFFSSSAVVMPCVIPAKSTPAFCAVSASTVLSPMYSVSALVTWSCLMASSRPSGDGLGVCTSSPPMMMSRKSSGKCWSSNSLMRCLSAGSDVLAPSPSDIL